MLRKHSSYSMKSLTPQDFESILSNEDALDSIPVFNPLDSGSSITEQLLFNERANKCLISYESIESLGEITQSECDKADIDIRKIVEREKDLQMTPVEVSAAIS